MQELSIMKITVKNVVRRCVECLAVALMVLPVTIAGQTLKVRILQTNGAGDSVSVIDPVTDKVVGEIKGIEEGHGVQAAPDGSRIFITVESDKTVVAVDGKTLKEIKRIPLSGAPHNLAFPRNTGKIYVAIHGAPGGVDVIDAKTLTKIKHIALDGMQIHNPFATPDGKFVMAESDEDKTKIDAIIDTKNDELNWKIEFDKTPRTAGFYTNPDGSTKWILQSLSGMSGFVVVDFATHKEIRRIETPWAGGKVIGMPSPGGGPHSVPSHGLAVAPDNKSVWVNSRMDNCVYAYSLPDLKLLGYVPTGYDAMWMTFTPDSKKLYDANNGAGTVSVIDTVAMKELVQIRVGQGPKRNSLAMLP
jgi:YVTN family beta-propeller protein